MKILEITESLRQRRTRIMYHGTSSVFLKSILKHGLIANPPKRAYSGNKTHDLGHMPYLASFHGVYLGEDWQAIEAAEFAVNKFGGYPIIVGVQIVIGSNHADEDDFTNILLNAISLVLMYYTYQQLLDLGIDHEEFEYLYDAFESNVIQKLDKFTHITNLDHPRLEHVQTELRNYFDLMITHLFEQAYEFRQSKQYTRLEDGVGPSHSDLDKLRFNPEYIKFVERFARLVRDHDNSSTFKIPFDIKFSGKNKILKIIRIDEKDKTVIWTNPNQ